MPTRHRIVPLQAAVRKCLHRSSLALPDSQSNDDPFVEEITARTGQRGESALLPEQAFQELNLMSLNAVVVAPPCEALLSIYKIY
jgi:hypothetical protein